MARGDALFASSITHCNMKCCNAPSLFRDQTRQIRPIIERSRWETLCGVPHAVPSSPRNQTESTSDSSSGKSEIRRLLFCSWPMPGGTGWAGQDSNLQPDRYERPALTIELPARPGAPPHKAQNGDG